MSKNKFPKGRLVGAILSTGVLFTLFLGLAIPDSLETQNNNIFFDVEQNPLIELCDDDLQCINDNADSITTSSVVDTQIDFTTNNPYRSFFDENGIPITEDFTIDTNVAVVSPNGTITIDSDIFGVSKLSVIDENGIVRDLDTIQLTFDGNTRNSQNTINVWGKVNFILDDTNVGSKFLWASDTNTDTVELSLVDDLIFDNTEKNQDIESEIETIKATLKIIDQLSIGQLRDLSEKYNTDANSESVGIALNLQILDLRENMKSEISHAVPPIISEQEKKNFTFTLSDEGRNWQDGSTHSFKAVLNELHVNTISDGKNNEYHFVGQRIVYDLTVKVIGTKTTILDDNNNAIAIFKSDNSLVFHGGAIKGKCHKHVDTFTDCLLLAEIPNNSLKVFVGDKLIGEITNDDHIVTNSNEICKSSSVSGFVGTFCSSNVSYVPPKITNIPRGTDITIQIGNDQYSYLTPESQQNIVINCELQSTLTQQGGFNKKSGICSSGFGYTDSINTITKP